MAGEIALAWEETGVTLYAHLHNKTGQIYRTDSGAFEAYATANIANYNIAMTEQGTASRWYLGTMPGVAAGVYSYTVLKRAGGSPAEGDVFVGSFMGYWSGSAWKDLPDVADWTPTRAGKIDTINSDTDDIQSRLPAALVSGRIDASVGAMAADVVTASAVAADAVTEIQAGLMTSAGYTAPDNASITAIKAKTDNLPGDPADASDISALLSALSAKLPVALVGGKMDSTLSSAERNSIADALLDLADAIETGLTPRKAIRGIAAALLGETSGVESGTPTFKGAGVSTPRVAATIDVNKNRETVDLTL